jgi:hypothetical protein
MKHKSEDYKLAAVQHYLNQSHNREVTARAFSCPKRSQEDAKCEKFRVRLEPKKKLAENERHLRLVHGLLACKKCNKLWNRDVNSAINTARLTRESLAGRSRPTYLSRVATPPEADSAVASTA